MSWRLAWRLLAWMLEYFGPVMLEWTVRELTARVKQEIGPGDHWADDKPAADETYIWDEEPLDECPPFA